MRFNPNTYNPVDDSTPGLSLATHAEYKGCVVLVQSDPVHCPCGCDTKPNGAKSKFVQGHDARLKGVLIRAHLTGTKVAYLEDRSGKHKATPQTAMTVAKTHGWGDHLAYAQERFDQRPQPKPRGASNAELVGTTMTVKVGRWDKEGTIVAATAKAFTVEYQTAKGAKQIEVAR